MPAPVSLLKRARRPKEKQQPGCGVEPPTTQVAAKFTDEHLRTRPNEAAGKPVFRGNFILSVRWEFYYFLPVQQVNATRTCGGSAGALRRVSSFRSLDFTQPFFFLPFCEHQRHLGKKYNTSTERMVLLHRHTANENILEAKCFTTLMKCSDKDFFLLSFFKKYASLHHLH